MAGDLYFSGQKTDRTLFQDRASRLAADMRARGVGPDDVIAVLMRNDTAFMAVAEAARLVGARYAAINWHAAPLEIQHILEDSGAALLYGHSDLLPPVMPSIPAGVTVISARVPPAISDAYGVAHVPVHGTLAMADVIETTAPFEGPAEKFRGMFAYTSGSTGRPKGIKRIIDPDAPDRWESYGLIASMLLGIQPRDSMYFSAPLYHSAPNALATMCLAAGAVDVFIDPKFDAEGFLRTIQDHRITHAYMVPTMMIRLLKLPEAVRNRYNVSSLRFTISTGSPCPADVKKAMIEWFGPVIHESYGASEIGFMTLITSEEALAKPGSVGKILPGGAVKVLDDDFNEVPAGQTGLLYVHLPTFGDYEYTNVDGSLGGQRQGAFSTVGDVGHVDEDGYIFISDRKKDMIISGGANIFPAEIEAHLIQMPDILDCAVFGAPDAEFGEIVAAAVTCKPGKTVTLESVRTFLEPRLARFKLPRILDVHDELPRQDSGKVFKQKLRASYWEAVDRDI
ncbi:MAG: AMP-binding protein [Alphaproteobacteria bacterium]